jgi:hypothetical protein
VRHRVAAEPTADGVGWCKWWQNETWANPKDSKPPSGKVAILRLHPAADRADPRFGALFAEPPRRLSFAVETGPLRNGRATTLVCVTAEREPGRPLRLDGARLTAALGLAAEDSRVHHHQVALEWRVSGGDCRRARATARLLVLAALLWGDAITVDMCDLAHAWPDCLHEWRWRWVAAVRGAVGRRPPITVAVESRHRARHGGVSAARLALEDRILAFCDAARDEAEAEGTD